VQAISLVTPGGGLYYHVKQGGFKGADIVEFLSMLLGRFKRRKLLIIWDGAASHCSKAVKEFLQTRANGRVHLERLPPYSPELNVDEQVHGYIKKNLLANRLFKGVEQIKQAVEEGYEYLKNNAQLVRRFFFEKNTAFYPS